MRRQTRVVILASAIATVGLVGCQSDQSSIHENRHEGWMPMQAADDDGEFAAMMAMHDESAIEMAKIESQRGQREDVRQLADRIVKEQSRENVQLEQIARESSSSPPKPDPQMDGHSQADVAALRSATPADVDRLFLVHMIDHHTQGVDMVQRSLPNLKNEELRRMANTMVEDQCREIKQMQSMLNR